MAIGSGTLNDGLMIESCNGCVLMRSRQEN